MAGNRLFIELVVGKNQNGTAKKKKFFAKSTMSLHDTMQAMRLGKKFQDQEKVDEDKQVIPMEIFDEMLYFVVEIFDKQFTQEQLEKGLPFGEEGFEILMNVIGDISNGNQEVDTKAFLEEKKN